MQKTKNPAVGNWQGFKENCSARWGYNSFSSGDLQGLCSHCVYFRAVKQDSGWIRRVCTFTGEKLLTAGPAQCEFVTFTVGGGVC